MFRHLWLLLVLSPLAACGSVSNAIKTPQLSAIAQPAQIPKAEASAGLTMASTDTARPTSANSLWRNGARAFFHDQRASHVGDILTVSININDSAQISNETKANRQASANLGLTNFFGLETTLGRLLPKAFTPGTAVNTSSNNQSDGLGSVNRTEAVTLTVAAVVTHVMPNGNLVIEGKQEVRINQELRELTVAGIVRPEDISSTNTIQHTQIAEARVSYGGKGQLSTVQNVPAGQAILNKFSPF
jgi:flagellar L-ring protein precursor FlgH